LRNCPYYFYLTLTLTPIHPAGNEIRRNKKQQIRKLCKLQDIFLCVPKRPSTEASMRQSASATRTFSPLMPESPSGMKQGKTYSHISTQVRSNFFCATGAQQTGPACFFISYLEGHGRRRGLGKEPGLTKEGRSQSITSFSRELFFESILVTSIPSQANEFIFPRDNFFGSKEPIGTSRRRMGTR